MPEVIETRGRGRPAKDKFDDLDAEWKDAVANSDPEEIKKRMADLAAEAEMQKQAMDADPEVQQLKDRLKTETADYKANIKGAKLRIQYCVEKLKDKGAL